MSCVAARGSIKLTTAAAPIATTTNLTSGTTMSDFVAPGLQNNPFLFFTLTPPYESCFRQRVRLHFFCNYARTLITDKIYEVTAVNMA